MKIGGNWTDDNRYIVYTGSDPRTKLDLWTLSVADRKPVPFLRTSFNEMHGQVSPDGRWLAYVSDESGTWEVFVRGHFPSRARSGRFQLAVAQSLSGGATDKSVLPRA